MIQAVIFDMDGLLIDSEPLWHYAEIEIFNKIGVPLTREMTRETMGMRSDELVRYWHHRFPWSHPSQSEIDKELIDKMVELISTQDIILPGVKEAINEIENLGLLMAIASSSPHRLINAAIKRLGISGNLDIIHSAEHELFGKPHPNVYITTAHKLGIRPEFCVAIEDSPNGVLAAKAAKMKCIAVPDTSMKSNPMFGIADITLNSLKDLTTAILQTI